jgi:hypothetical protein
VDCGNVRCVPMMCVCVCVPPQHTRMLSMSKGAFMLVLCLTARQHQLQAAASASCFGVAGCAVGCGTAGVDLPRPSDACWLASGLLWTRVARSGGHTCMTLWCCCSCCVVNYMTSQLQCRCRRARWCGCGCVRLLRGRCCVVLDRVSLPTLPRALFHTQARLASCTDIRERVWCTFHTGCSHFDSWACVGTDGDDCEVMVCLILDDMQGLVCCSGHSVALPAVAACTGLCHGRQTRKRSAASDA